MASLRAVNRASGNTIHLARVGKYRNIFENIKIYQKYHYIFDIFDTFDTFDIFQKKKILNKLYNNGRNTLMQHFLTISYQSFVPCVKT